jgi:hypothetical protein
MSKVFQEYDPQLGIATTVHDLDNRVVIEKKYESDALRDICAAERAATDGQKWGEWRKVGSVPMAELATMLRQDGTLDQERAAAWLKKNPAFVTFNKFLK